MKLTEHQKKIIDRVSQKKSICIGIPRDLGKTKLNKEKKV